MFGERDGNAFLIFLGNLWEFGADGERFSSVSGEETGADGGEGFDER